MKQMSIFAGLVAVGAWLCAAGLSSADDKKEGDKKEGGDKEFVLKASAGGLGAVNLSKLAVLNASNPAVKDFARRMSTEHGQANRQLLALANEKGFPAAKTMDEAHQKLFEKLSKLTGADFDRTYLDAIAKDHEEDIKLFETESKDGKDAALKEWAGKMVPALKMHLKMAQDLAKQLK
jgi:putative membrane protein